MINFKNRIGNNFSNACKTYDDYAQTQKESAYLLVKFLKENLPKFSPKSILDLGTGTGYVLNELITNYPYSSYTLNDISYEMGYLTAKKFSPYLKIKVEIGDMEVINFEPHDLIISNFAFQWLSDLKQSIKNFYESSKVLAFTCLLNNTFSELKCLLERYNIPIPLLIYPSKAEFTTWLKSLSGNKLFVVNKKFIINFNYIRDFFKYLKNIGAKVPQVTPMGNIDNMKKLLLHKKKFNTYYDVLFVILYK